MINIDDLVLEFDDTNKIVHVTAKKPIHITTLDEGEVLCTALNRALSKFLLPGRGYMITDYSKIILEPKHIDIYAEEISKIMEIYLYPDGLARYGFEVSRITARRSHEEYLGGTPNLFQTKDEAFGYIHSLIEKGKASETADIDPDRFNDTADMDKTWPVISETDKD
jgi:hypothetical protein